MMKKMHNPNAGESNSPEGEPLRKKKSESQLPAPFSEQKSGEEKPAVDVNDAQAMIRRMREMHEELEQKIQYIYDNIHHLPQELQKYLTETETVVKNHDAVLDKYKKDLEEKVSSVLGTPFVASKKKKREKKKMKRGMKAQKLQGKKKWIPMP